jgi:Leucine-rich repeat (LRR) protein
MKTIQALSLFFCWRYFLVRTSKKSVTSISRVEESENFIHRLIVFPEIRAKFTDSTCQNLPQRPSTCKNLKLLHLNADNIRQLPSEMASLDSLQQLNLFQNHLSTLPKEIAQLKRLKESILLTTQLTFQSKPLSSFVPLNLLVIGLLYFQSADSDWAQQQIIQQFC